MEDKEWIIIAPPEDMEKNRFRLQGLQTSLPEGFTVGKLRPEHLDAVLAEWRYLKHQPEERVQYLIEEVSNSCVLSLASQ